MEIYAAKWSCYRKLLWQLVKKWTYEQSHKEELLQESKDFLIPDVKRESSERPVQTDEK